MTTTIDAADITHGAVLHIPLNRLKKSPRNARKTPHPASDIEALAASIKAKTMYQPPVVEPELGEDGAPTGYYLVTIGEGRRQAQLLRAKRKEIKNTEPIRCVIDTEHDAHEISLDENVTRSEMHPADQFEAFQRLADERGLGAEDIAARFGVTATVVRQRLRLAAVSPRLMQMYRDEEMSLGQLTAFTLTEDHGRQEALWSSLQSWDRDPTVIRRHLTRDRVSAGSRYARFVGVEAYQAAGGVVERDLFAEDHGGYFVDPALLDRLALERLQQEALPFDVERWKWVLPSLDFPNGHGFRRVYPEVSALSEADQDRRDRLSAELGAFEAVEWTEEVKRSAEVLVQEIEAIDVSRLSFRTEDKAMAGVILCIGGDGALRIERGFVRPEDEPRADEEGGEAAPDDEQDKENASSTAPQRASLSDKLVADLTAHRTAALRDALAQQPSVAFLALLQALVIQTFPEVRVREQTCLEVRTGHTRLTGYGAGIAETRAEQAITARHEGWENELSQREGDLWTFLAALAPDRAVELLAHCLSLTVNGVEARDRAWTNDQPIDHLARALALDMASYWTPTADNYFSRVSKPRILEAVKEAVSDDAAQRISGAKKRDMAEAAEQLIAGTGWLPEPFRAPVVNDLSEVQAA